MQTEPEKDDSPADLFSEPPEKIEDQILELQERIQKEVDGRNEERLIWFLVVLILLDVYFFTSIGSFFGALVIGILQILLFILVARKLGMEQVVQLIDRMIATVARGVSGKGD